MQQPDPGDAAAYARLCQGRGAAGLAWALSTFTGPATVLFAELVGEPVTVDVWHRVGRTATPAECAILHAPAGTAVSERHATMRGGTGRTGFAAEVRSVLIPARLPAGAATDLAGTVPLGLIVAKYARREPLGAVPYMGGVAAAARLWIGDLPLATASEQVMPWLCTLLTPKPSLS